VQRKSGLGKWKMRLKDVLCGAAGKSGKTFIRPRGERINTTRTTKTAATTQRYFTDFSKKYKALYRNIYTNGIYVYTIYVYVYIYIDFVVN